MGGLVNPIEARTKGELRRKAQKWTREMREAGMDVRNGWDPEQVVQTESGYQITLWAHT
jgi:hypothetical protein